MFYIYKMTTICINVIPSINNNYIPIFIFPIQNRESNVKITYYQRNKEKILEKYYQNKDKNNTTYYKKNKEKILNKYYENKEERLKYQIEYNQCHKDDLKERNRLYYIENREKMIEKAYKYKEENKEKLNKKITCECGGKFLFLGQNKHLQTRKHILFISKK